MLAIEDHVDRRQHHTPGLVPLRVPLEPLVDATDHDLVVKARCGRLAKHAERQILGPHGLLAGQIRVERHPA